MRHAGDSEITFNETDARIPQGVPSNSVLKKFKVEMSRVL